MNWRYPYNDTYVTLNYIATVQLNLNFTHVCGYMCAWTRFAHVKVYNVECIFFQICRAHSCD